MNRSRQVSIGLAIVAVLGAAATLTVTRRRDRGAEVRFDVVERMDLVETVTASGNIRAGRVVQVSSDISARVAKLLVDEGDDVTEGQVMLRLDPTQFDATVSRTLAALNQARAEASQQEVSLERATRDFERLRGLFERDSLLVKPAAARRCQDRRGLGLRQDGVPPIRRSPGGGLAGRSERASQQDRISSTHLRKGHPPQRGGG